MDAYVINLDRHPGRWRGMVETLGARIPLRRVCAIDGNHLSQRTVERLTAGHNLKLTRFELACALSHRKAWRMFLRSGAARCAIFEDDVRIGHDLETLLDELDQGEIRFDIVKLETYGPDSVILGRRARRHAGRELRALHSTEWGAAGYVINRQAARTLLRVSRSLVAPVDHFLFRDIYLKSNRLTVLQTIPAAVVQRRIDDGAVPSGEFCSAIGEHGVAPKPMGWRKIAREIRRPFRQLDAAIAKRRWVPMRVEFE